MVSLQYIPYTEIEGIPSEKRIDKLLDLAKKNKIVVMQGRLRPVEETALIQKTMESVNKTFKGIEHCVIYPHTTDNRLFNKLRHMLVSLLAGRIEGMTIIGPATVIKEIKRNPDKIELILHNKRQNGRK
jgi:hypothetical protein